MNILIIKTGALGDVVRTSFIAQALKEKNRFIPTTLYWLTDKKAAPFFINNVYVNKVVSIQSKKDTDKLKNIFFDLIINLEEGEDLCKLASNLSHKRLVGFYYKNGGIFPTHSTKEWYDMSAIGKKPQNDILKKKNKKTHRQIMAEIVGVEDYKKYQPFLRLTSQQRKFARDFFRRHNLNRTELIIGINIGGAERWPKSLSVQKTVSLIDSLNKKYKAKFLLFGGPNEVEQNNQIIARSNVPIILTGCGNDLLEFPALISTCNLFITTDSLGLHLSLALKRKTICLIGPTSSAEIEMYGLGEKVVAKSKEVCTYRNATEKCMNSINLSEVFLAVERLLQRKITLLITAYKEPNIREAIEAALNQKTGYNYEILISVPDKETIEIVKKYSSKDKRITIFKDPGKGKSYALNLIFSNLNTDILILTDGDVYTSNNTVEDIANIFLDPEIGCVSGRPVPQEDKSKKYGYWANFLFDAAHKIRKKAHESDSFLECSGYLFAFRKQFIQKIPIDVAEDTVIPFIFWGKGYRIGYVETAEVFVKNANNLKDWIKQKIRTHKSHGRLSRYVDIITTSKVKSFKLESRGFFQLMRYPTNLQELLWTFELAAARLYTWIRFFLDTHIFDRHYNDSWERIESTK